MAACTRKKTNTFLDLFKTHENIVLAETMPELKKYLQEPSTFYCINQYFLFSEPKLDTLLFIYDTQSKQGQRTITRGQGVNETSKITDFSIGKDATSCSICDVSVNAVFLLNLKDTSSISIQKDTLLDRGKTISSVAYDDTLSFYETVGTDKRFTLVTPNKTIHFGNDISIRGLSSSILTKVLQGPCSLSSSKKKFFWFSAYGDVFEIYDYSNIENINTVCSLVENLPNINSNGALRLKDKFGVSCVASDDKYIYALYSGKTLEQCLEDRSKAFYSNKILVFDWDGNPCKVLHLDCEMFSIAYSKTYDKLYGLGLDDDLNYTIYAIDNI